MRVIIIGAGIGGLTLAQALRRLDVEVRLYDRDPDISVTRGYRLHLDPVATDVLRAHLPPQLYQALRASSAGWRSDRQFGYLDHRLRLLYAKRRDVTRPSLQVGRQPLRRLLASGLGGELRWGAKLTAVELDGRGLATAHFADGSADRADLLVGADGVHSQVAPTLAGRATATALDAGGVVGRTQLSDQTRHLLPEVLSAGAALAFGPGGISMFLSVQDPGATADVDARTCVDIPADVEPANLVWGFNAGLRRFPSDPRQMTSVELHELAVSMLGAWSPRLRELVRAAEPDSVSYFGFHAASPDAPLTPWRSGAITALGDAVHAMPPTCGLGAGTAIRDAGGLADELRSVLAGRSTVPLATSRFERSMDGYARAAIRTCLRPLAWQQRLDGPVRFRLALGALGVIGTTRRVRRGSLRQW